MYNHSLAKDQDDDNNICVHQTECEWERESEREDERNDQWQAVGACVIHTTL